jgi:hypothetical protein
MKQVKRKGTKKYRGKAVIPEIIPNAAERVPVHAIKTKHTWKGE